MKRPLSFRCGEDWAAMGTGARRTCATCAETVTDLSAGSELRARVLLATGAAGCVRYDQRPDGHIRFRPSRLAAIGRRLSRWATAAAAVVPWASPAQAEPAADLPPGVHFCSSVPRAGASMSFEPGGDAETGSLRFVVSDLEMDLPIPRIAVVLSDGTVTETDADGVATITGVAPGTYTVELSGFGAGMTLAELPVATGRTTVERVRMALGSELVGVLVDESRGMRLRRWLRLLARGTVPEGRAYAHVAVGELPADRVGWERVAVRCEGSTRPLRTDLVDGEALFESIPEHVACRARLSHGDRPLVVEFTGGEAEVEIQDP